ncbi:hypothetical protein ES288_A05G294000v1 [Gossypium darwinii]|uniref:Uncharacterized protein n=2 Tax=Gossypium TaxID=3633 RepID=A0A5D2QM49_GOSTO|nr:hypothetical protein ES288_A05G294000v1 [Gossypium darwinii]TYI29172.1 hypothetical protein ES332_A05G298200v1 [Gossypium tomentosum]
MSILLATETNRQECLVFNPLDYSIHQDFGDNLGDPADESKPTPHWDRVALD